MAKKTYNKVDERDGVVEWRLNNGMKVLTVSDRRAPIATFAVVYRVGSRNEAIGYTGITHFLEHMMFKGTPHHNDKKKTGIDILMRRVGAEYNATTWLDRTNYFATIPVQYLNTYLEIEADRMQNLVLKTPEINSERTVVLNEMERAENDPMRDMRTRFFATAFEQHPYHHPTLGWKSDVENFSQKLVQWFYKTYYRPNNATAVLAGDFTHEEAIAMVAKYFAPIQPKQEAIPVVYTKEPPQRGERRFTLERPAPQPMVMIGFHIPNAMSEEIPAIEVLDAIMSGAWGKKHSTRLYRALVETDLATSAVSTPDVHLDPGLFRLWAELHPNTPLEKAEEILWSEIDRIKKGDITDKELERAKRQLEVQMTYAREGIPSTALSLAEAEAQGDWKLFITRLPTVEKVTKEDIVKVANTYLTRENATVGFLKPTNPAGKEEASPEKTKKESLSPEHYYLKSFSYDNASFYKSELSGEDTLGVTGAKQTSSTKLILPQTSFASQVKEYKLKNGARLFTLPISGSNITTIRGYTNAGNHLNPQKRLFIASTTAGLLDRGTTKHTKLELAEELEGRGITASFATDWNHLDFSASCIKKEAETTLNLLAEMLRSPKFDNAEFEKWKHNLLTQIEVTEQDPGTAARYAMSRLIYPEGHPYYVFPKEYRQEQISKLTLDEINKFYTSNYGGEGMVMVITGGFDEKTVVKQVESLFGDWQGGSKVAPVPPAPTNFHPTQRVLEIPGKSSDVILFSIPVGIERSAPDYHSAFMANRIFGMSTLSSRLGEAVRKERGLTYGISSYFSNHFYSQGLFNIIATANPKRVSELVATTKKTAKKYRAEELSSEELLFEKQGEIGSFQLDVSRSEFLAEWIKSSVELNLGIDYVDRYPKAIKEVSLKDIKAATERYINAEGAAIIIAGPRPDLVIDHSNGN